MDHQIIEYDGKPAFVLVPIEDYERSLSDEAFMRRAKKEDDGKRYPAELTRKLIEGENPVKLFREYVEMTQEVLAFKTGLSKNFISMLETGRRNITDNTARKIAKVLDIDPDLLTE